MPSTQKDWVGQMSNDARIQLERIEEDLASLQHRSIEDGAHVLRRGYSICEGSEPGPKYDLRSPEEELPVDECSREVEDKMHKGYQREMKKFDSIVDPISTGLPAGKTVSGKYGSSLSFAISDPFPNKNDPILQWSQPASGATQPYQYPLEENHSLHEVSSPFGREVFRPQGSAPAVEKSLQPNLSPLREYSTEERKRSRDDKYLAQDPLALSTDPISVFSDRPFISHRPFISSAFLAKRRRRYTPEEKAAIQKRRELGSCERCKLKKKKCDPSHLRSWRDTGVAEGSKQSTTSTTSAGLANAAAPSLYSLLPSALDSSGKRLNSLLEAKWILEAEWVRKPRILLIVNKPGDQLFYETVLDPVHPEISLVLDISEAVNTLRTGAIASSGPIPSDSGYHSGRGSDTDSVCSMDSFGSSLGLPTDFLQEFITLFGDLLIERAGARAWAASAIANHNPNVVELRLKTLLKSYALELSSGVERSRASGLDPKVSMDATRMIRRYRPKIARYFCANATTASTGGVPMESRVRELGKQLSLSEKIVLLNQSTTKSNDPTEGAGENPSQDGEIEDEDYDTDEEVVSDLKPIQEYLLTGEPFKRLVTAMRRVLYCDEGAKLEEIRLAVLQGLTEAGSYPSCGSSIPKTDSYKKRQAFCVAKFHVQWNLVGFLRSQYDGQIPALGKIIAVSGSALYAHATTCSMYLRENWPRSGAFILSTLQRAVDAFEATTSSSSSHAIGHQEGLVIEVRIIGNNMDHSSPGSISIEARGTEDLLVELAQQLSWMGAALGSSPLDDRVAYSKAQICARPKMSSPEFDISFLVRPLQDVEKPCWLPLFENAIIAYEFPIPERQDEMGLEIPMHIMAGIAGARHAVEYEGGVVLKGFSNMLAPMKRVRDCVQWHLISSKDCDTRLSYQDVLVRLPNRARVEEVSLETLQTTRAIVGWCSATTLLLGDEAANYENIDYSGAEESASPLKISGGTIGFQQFGVAQLDYALGTKDGKSHFQRNSSYRSIISAAERTPVTLYDTAEKRAWLVPASSVILHIAQNRHWIEPFEVGGKRIRLFSTDPSQRSPRDILKQSASTSLSDFETYTLRDMVTNIWSLLEFLLDQKVRHDNVSGIPVKGVLRDVIQGFEFKAVVEERSPFRQKQCCISKTSGGWTSLVKDIDALILFANGFEDIIRPTNTSDGLCHLWRSVPKWKDYLATTVGTIKDLYSAAGCRLSREYLTSTRLQWHRGSSMLLEPCPLPSSYRCRCNRLQQIIPKSAIGKIVGPGPLEKDNSGVIFGQTGTLLQNFGSSQKTEQAGLYCQANVLLTTTTPDYKLEGSLAPMTLESESSTPSSETSGTTPVSSATSYSSQNNLDPSIQDVQIGSCSFTRAPKRRWSAGTECGTSQGFRTATGIESKKRTKRAAEFDMISEPSTPCVQLSESLPTLPQLDLRSTSRLSVRNPFDNDNGISEAEDPHSLISSTTYRHNSSRKSKDIELPDVANDRTLLECNDQVVLSKPNYQTSKTGGAFATICQSRRKPPSAIHSQSSRTLRRQPHL